MIVLDCVGIEALSQYGVGTQDDFAKTPAIDRLIAEGVQFQNAWAMPTCSPTRASVLLGQYPFRHGIGLQISQGGTSLAVVTPQNTLPSLLRTASPKAYATFAAGKWHLSGNTSLIDGDPAAPQNMGFDWFEGEMFHVPGLYVDPLDGTSQWTKYVWDGMCVVPEPSDGVDYLLTQQVQDAIDYFSDRQSQDPNQPVFLWLGLQEPFEIHQRPPATHSQAGLDFPGLTQPGERFRTSEDRYPCFVETLHAADQEIGQLLDEIELITSKPWYDSTTVMLFGDNGSPGNVAQFPFSLDHAKGSLFEGGVRVPFFVSGRIVETSRKTAIELTPVQVIDVYASCLEIAGIPVPTGYKSDSISLLSLVDNPSPSSYRTFVYSEKFATNIDDPNELPHTTGDNRIAKMVDSDGEWKLFHSPPTSPGGLLTFDLMYELVSTPWELGSPVYPLQVGDPNAALYSAKRQTLLGFINQLYVQ